MNFFAHCCVAAWSRSDAGYALGSMLPDFATMSGGRLRGSEDDAVAAGIALHHTTDAVFHAAPSFIALCKRSAARMDRSDVRWGTARAVAHVGVELFLDGWLLPRQDESTRTIYLNALDRAQPADLGSHLRWHDPHAPARFEALRRRLRGYGLPSEIGEPKVVFSRLERTLEGRARLKIMPRDAAAVQDEMQAMSHDVEEAADRLMNEVQRGL